MKAKEKIIVKEFFETISYLLSYEYDEEWKEVTKSILKLILQIGNMGRNFKKIWEMMEASACLQVLSERKLAQINELNAPRYVLDLKIELLERNEINTLRRFDKDLFVEKMKEQAFIGEKRACKILACLYWLGYAGENKAEDAINLWELLATGGDFFAMKALIYAHKKKKNTLEEGKWTRVHELTSNAFERGIPNVINQKLQSGDAEVELANLIISMKQVGAKPEAEYMNRMMMYYILHSEEPYEEKMMHLDEAVKYNLLLQQEKRYKNRHLGF